jgi:DNA-binding FrmR family transcriptional regulator
MNAELAEQEVDLASAWERVKARWWLPVVGLVAGAFLGLVLALSGGDVWRADTIVYLGQPFAPLGGGQIQSLATNPRTVSEVVRSEAAIDAAAEASGVSKARLRSSISTKEITAVGQARGVNPLIVISVKASGPTKAEAAADALAERVVERVSSYVAEKTKLLERQVEVAEGQLAAIEKRISQAQAQQDALLQNQSLAPIERLILSQNLNAVITTADARRSAVQDDLNEAEQFLNLAANVESSKVVEPAAAAKTTARSRRTSVLIGALIGLVLGVLAAVLAEPFVARRRRTASDTG